MKESNVLRACWLAVARWTRLFRLNTGQAWVGKAERLANGDVLVHGGRPITIGLGMPDGKPLVGASDLIGWTTVEITPEMVGRRVAVFTGIETKESGGGHQRPDQINFVDQLRAAGGIAGFAHTPAVAQAIVHDWAAETGARLAV